MSTRFDHTVTSKQRLMARYTRNDRRESRSAIYGEVNGIVPTGNFLFRKNDGVTVDHTWTSERQFAVGLPRRLAAVPGAQRAAARRAVRSGVARVPGGGGQPVRRRQLFPAASRSTRISDIGDNLAGNTTHTIYSFQPTYTRLAGDHSIRAGYDLRKYHEFGANAGRQAGDYLIQQRRRVHPADQQLGGPELARTSPAS